MAERVIHGAMVPPLWTENEIFALRMLKLQHQVQIILYCMYYSYEITIYLIGTTFSVCLARITECRKPLSDVFDQWRG